MKKLLLSLFTMLVLVSSNFAVNSGNWKMKVQEEVGAFEQEMPQMTLNDFMELTPAKYRKATGNKLGIKNTLKLKAAQKFLKKNLNNAGDGGDIPEGLYIVLAIFGLCWIAMGVLDDWTGNNWWVNLLLSLCWLPGLIHALVKKNEYY